MSAELYRVVVRVPVGAEEEARARALELAPNGFEERIGPYGLELAIYTDGGGLDRVRAVFPEAAVTPVAPGWDDAWRAFHRPVVAGGVWIGPPWETAPPELPTVVIDPGRAFGTGAHATTRLCVELLARLERGSLLDVGCGSGVLAIAAARLGFAPIVAIDSDAVAVEVTLANARANGVELEALRLDALVGPMPAADVAVANVLLAPVETILSRLTSGRVVTSGYLAGECPAHVGWDRLDTVEMDGWAADSFRRSPPPTRPRA
jgi:ribosomal protein L11 methyltransferase